MAKNSELMAAGLPALAAFMLGTDSNAAVTPAGSDQAGATLLTCPVSTLGTASAAGVRLPPAAGQPPYLIANNSGANQSLYPATGETLNALTANSAFTVTSAKTAIAVPAGNKWIVILSA